MLHTVLDFFHLTQLVNKSITQLNIKLFSKKLRAHSPKKHYFSIKAVQQVLKQMT